MVIKLSKHRFFLFPFFFVFVLFCFVLFFQVILLSNFFMLSLFISFFVIFVCLFAFVWFSIHSSKVNIHSGESSCYCILVTVWSLAPSLTPM